MINISNKSSKVLEQPIEEIEQLEGYDELDEDNLITCCPVCDGPGIFLGALGKMQYFRCRDCGMDFSA